MRLGAHIRVLQHHEVYRARRRLGSLVARPRSRALLLQVGLARRYSLVTNARLERLVLVPS